LIPSRDAILSRYRDGRDAILHRVPGRDDRAAILRPVPGRETGGMARNAGRDAERGAGLAAAKRGAGRASGRRPEPRQPGRWR
jgi:hypothetical protein